MGHFARGTTARLPHKFAGSVLLLLLLLCISACGGEGSADLQARSVLNSQLEADVQPVKVALSMDQHYALCQQSRSRQLDEFLDLKLRHSREAWDVDASPLANQLIGARHALEEAQLNYDHAREDVRLDCYHRREA